MGYEVEFLKIGEINAFCSVFGQVLGSCFPGYTSKIIRFFLEKIYTKNAFYYWTSNKLKTILVAKSESEIVGFAVIDEPYGGVSFCRWLGIKKDYQKKGIGNKLIRTWLDLAISQKCHKLEVAAQPEAKGFYEKVGLELEGNRKLSYFGINQYLFGKVIGKPDEDIMTMTQINP